MIAFASLVLALELAAPTGHGDHSRPITTARPAAQAAFDEGLALLSAFNHDEAIRAFTDATTADASCAMCFFGLGLAWGPHINWTELPPDRADAAFAASRQAQVLAAPAGAVTDVERALIDALAQRYAKPAPLDRASLDQAYAAAMKKVQARFVDDVDVRAWTAEALLDLRPWDQWAADGKAQPGTDEVLALLEGALAKQPNHPLANHLLIHALEASPTPERADAAAERLRTLAPGLGHLVHMPSHIDVRRGRWMKAIETNAAAILVDDAYLKAHPETGFYRSYVLHNRHMAVFAAMMSGQQAIALQRTSEIEDSIPEEWITQAPQMIDGFLALRFEVLVRFGQWDAILAQPEPRATLPFSRALYRYARGVALAAKKDLAAAKKEQAAFEKVRAGVSRHARFGANKQRALLDVATAMLEAEVQLGAGRLDKAAAGLEEATRAEALLKYDEPPDWILPPRHAFGAALLRLGRVDEAEAVYRADLLRWPDNVWSLWGLTTALEAQKKSDLELTARFDAARARADIPLTTSCFCLPGM